MSARPLFQRLERSPDAVELFGYEDYRRMFMAIGREHVQSLVDAGEYHPDFEHDARLWAGFHATEALLRPGRAAAAAIAFCARCCGDLELIRYREAAE